MGILRSIATRNIVRPTRDPSTEFMGRRGKRIILRSFYSPGDLVMLTAAVRDLHQCYPGRFITDVRTDSPALWENNPYLTSLDANDADVKVLECHYPLIQFSNQRPVHFLHGFIEYLNDRL